MGYRIRLGKIPKAAKEKYSGSYEEVSELLDEVGVSTAYPPEHTQLYEIGKYIAFESGRTPFYNFDTTDDDYEFDILSKDGLKHIIMKYHQLILKNYQELQEAINTADEDGINKVLGFINSRIAEWEPNKFGLSPYYLDEKKTDGEIVSSWKIEYAIFNLVYIYRTFDWENDYLIYSGW